MWLRKAREIQPGRKLGQFLGHTVRYRGERGVGGRAESWFGEKDIQRKREGEFGTSLGNHSCWAENTVTDTLVYWPASGDISHYFTFTIHST